jgi:hypothetical protein
MPIPRCVSSADLKDTRLTVKDVRPRRRAAISAYLAQQSIRKKQAKRSLVRVLARRRWLRKRAVQARIKQLEENIAKVSEEVERLRGDNLELSVRVLEYRGKWLTDARVLAYAQRYIPEDELGEVLSSQARDDTRSSPFNR